MRKFLKLVGPLFLILVLATACKKHPIDEPVNPDEINSKEQQRLLVKVNDFVAETVALWYFWTGDILWDKINTKKEPDSKAFFKDKLRQPEDRWSFVTDDQKQLTESFQGVVTTYGYDLRFSYYTNSDNLFGIVYYVYPGTPADKAGLKRGDLLVKLNGGAITEANYMDLLKSASLTLTKGVLADGAIKEDPATVSMNAIKMYEDPIIDYRVIEKGAHKIGYLNYADFTMDSELPLVALFQEFKSKGITDMVLDLRYNGGGYARTSTLLASILAPQAAVKNKEVLLEKRFNKTIADELKKEGYQLDSYFTDTLPVNLDLKRLYVLTTRGTASASESTIIGLKAYLDVVLVGDTTHGKFCGGPVLMPTVPDPKNKNKRLEDKEISNWGLYLITYRFYNKKHYPAVIEGMAPDHLVKESLETFYPFGDERDPLLAKVIELVTGVPTVEQRSKTEFPVGKSFYVEHRPLTNMMIDTDMPLMMPAE